jgi:hypothetical protein
MQNPKLIEEYIKCMENFIDNMNNKMNLISFDELYRNNYNMTISGNHECMITMFKKARNEIIKLNIENKRICLNMLFNIFMYPLRMGCIPDQKCLLCNLNVPHKELYCNEHMKYEKHLSNIRSFNTFNNYGLVGGNIYHNIYNDI